MLLLWAFPGHCCFGRIPPKGPFEVLPVMTGFVQDDCYEKNLFAVKSEKDFLFTLYFLMSHFPSICEELKMLDIFCGANLQRFFQISPNNPKHALFSGSLFVAYWIFHYEPSMEVEMSRNTPSFLH